MKPDLTNEHGIAALFVAPESDTSVGMNYVLTVDGLGLMTKNRGGASAWTSFVAIPPAVDIAEVADWTPWTLYTQAGTWWMRGHIFAGWAQAGTGGESAQEAPYVMPRDPRIQIAVE